MYTFYDHDTQSTITRALERDSLWRQLGFKTIKLAYSQSQIFLFARVLYV